MEKLNVAICDDDMNVREQVKNFLNDFFQHKQIDVTYHLFEDGYDLIQNKQSLDIIILDIEMNKCNGFEVRDVMFSERINSRIIYLSDYKDQLQDAFGKNVYGFVSKDSMNDMTKYLNIIINEMREHHVMAIANHQIDLYNLVYIHSDGAYCHFVLSNGEEFFERIYLNIVEEELKNNHVFCRIHRSYIVNFKYVKRCTYDKVYLVTETLNKQDLPISPKNSKIIKQKYINYIKEKESDE